MAERMRSTEHGLNVAKQAIENAYDGVDNVVRNVFQSRNQLASAWTGQAATGFDGAIAAWIEKVDKLKTEMEEMGLKLHATRNEFEALEDEQSRKAVQWADAMSGNRSS
ncbi:WXG100 family type VII secretion target [Streptomyces cacaoi]|uniref:WXG100 family type VII secretion target n=1 Tax=Streptomyces cacaoi TaxID=1898 RepID=UPI0011F39B12|nr:WXG100 family type VII secretion target [Streptomyces cacaoi]